MRRRWVLVAIVVVAVGSGASYAIADSGPTPKASDSNGWWTVPPPFLNARVCPRHARPLGADAVALAARVALRAEGRGERPFLIAAALADAAPADARATEVRHYCGRRVWQRTVVVRIQLRRYLPSASLSERVSFVDRTDHGYTVYALGH